MILSLLILSITYAHSFTSPPKGKCVPKYHHHGHACHHLNYSKCKDNHYTCNWKPTFHVPTHPKGKCVKNPKFHGHANCHHLDYNECKHKKWECNWNGH
jgi:hypothetical protein